LPLVAPEDRGTRLIDDEEATGLSKAGTWEDAAGVEMAALPPLASGAAPEGFNGLLPESEAGPGWLAAPLGLAALGGLSSFLDAELDPVFEATSGTPSDGPVSLLDRSPNGSTAA